MIWDLELKITDVSEKPIAGVPVTAAADGTLLNTTKASGTALVTLNVTDEDIHNLLLDPLPPAAAGSVFSTWKVALTLTNYGSPVRDVDVRVGNVGTSTRADGTAELTFKIFASVAQGLAIEVGNKKRTAFGVTMTENVTSAFAGVVHVDTSNSITSFR